MPKFCLNSLVFKVLVFATAFSLFGESKSQAREISLRDDLYYQTLEVAKTKDLAKIQGEFDRLKRATPSPTGTPALIFAFSAFGNALGGPEATIEQALRWLETNPNSIVAKLILLDALLNQTSNSRGRSPYNALSELQRGQFQKHLAQFSAALQSHQMALAREPLWYGFRISAYLWEGTPSKEDIFKLVDKAQELDNKDVVAANSAINWFVRGSSGATKKDLDNFIVKVTSSNNNGFGVQMYFRLYNEVENAYGADPNVVPQLMFSNQRLRAGLEDYYQTNPNDLTARIATDVACYYGFSDLARQFRSVVKNPDPNWYKNDPAQEESTAKCLSEIVGNVPSQQPELAISTCTPDMRQHTTSASVIAWHRIASPIILCDMSLIINNSGGVGVVRPNQALFLNQLPAITAFAYGTFNSVSGPVGSLNPQSRWIVQRSEDAGSIGLPGTLAWGKSIGQNERGAVIELADYNFGLESWRYPRDGSYVSNAAVAFPQSSGSLENKPWPKGSNQVVYRQIASTRFGRNGPAEQASIQINTAAGLEGILQLSLPLYVNSSPQLQKQSLSIALRRSVLDSASSSNNSWSAGEFRLRQGQPGAGGIVDCFSETRNPALTKCPLKVPGVSSPPNGPKVKFSATGAFFGYQSEYLAIQLMIDGDVFWKDGKAVESVAGTDVGTIVLRRE
jgi:hypothetical protein